MKLLVNNRNFGPKIEILVKNENNLQNCNFRQKFIFKMDILVVVYIFDHGFI